MFNPGLTEKECSVLNIKMLLKRSRFYKVKYYFTWTFIKGTSNNIFFYNLWIVSFDSAFYSFVVMFLTPRGHEWLKAENFHDASAALRSPHNPFFMFPWWYSLRDEFTATHGIFLQEFHTWYLGANHSIFQHPNCHKLRRMCRRK